MLFKILLLKTLFAKSPKVASAVIVVLQVLVTTR